MTCLFLSWFGTAPAQDFDLKLDYARYKYDNQASLLEIYYSLDASRLTARTTDKENIRAAVMELHILRNDTLWVADAWRVQLAAEQRTPNLIENRLIDVLRYVAAPGRYHVELKAMDVASQASQQAELDFRVEAMPPSEAWLSDIELAAVIRQEESDSTQRAFHKNQLLVIPQTDRTYSDQRPMLYYYLEAYNLPENLIGDGYKVKSYITDMQGKPIDDVRGRTVTKPKSTHASAEVGSLHLGKLAAGDYQLNIEIVSLDDHIRSKKTKPFVMVAAPVVASTALPSEFIARFAAMSEKQITTAFKQAAYMMSKEDQKLYEQLTGLEAKRQFLAEFWGRRDPAPSTLENEFYLEYQRRIAHANENLRSFAREGWQTDRGRVYIIYGPPNDIEFFPSTENNRPYERWRYDNLEGGVEFIFVDRTGFKEYRLVHSSKIGEIKDPDWQRQLTN
jgi:GWxTD domain-containing protein